MKRGVQVLAGLLIIMIAGSVLTAGVWGGFPTIKQTADPLASYFQTTPSQATFFFIVVMALVSGAIVNGLVIGGIIWFLNREMKVTENMPTRSEREDSEALPETASA
ncbi:MAG: hypothetical protein Q9P01_19580 [Anaerolineae bacterium]|nr:hypothetical protein [Anaerolineae bacterium]MDQ7036951.1 hypothetical protein [Anaerolineae bacterium]